MGIIEEEVNKVLDQAIDEVLQQRASIYALMADAKATKANGKYFAYNKCYCKFSAIKTALEEKKRK